MELLRRTSEQMHRLKRPHRFVMVLLSCLAGSTLTYTENHSYLPVVCDDPSIFSDDGELAACQAGKDVFVTRQDGEWRVVPGEFEGMSDEGANFQRKNSDESVDRCSLDRNFQLKVKPRSRFL